MYTIHERVHTQKLDTDPVHWSQPNMLVPWTDPQEDILDWNSASSAEPESEVVDMRLEIASSNGCSREKEGPVSLCFLGSGLLLRLPK